MLAAQLPIKRLFDGAAVWHRQHVSADMVDFFDVVVAVLVFLEPDSEAIKLLNHTKAVCRVFVDRGLVDDAIVGDGDFLGVLLRRRITWNDGVVEAIHAHGDRAGPLDVGLLDQNHISRRIFLLCPYCRHRPGGAAADDQHVAFDLRYRAANLVHRASFLAVLASINGRWRPLAGSQNRSR